MSCIVNRESTRGTRAPPNAPLLTGVSFVLTVLYLNLSWPSSPSCSTDARVFMRFCSKVTKHSFRCSFVSVERARHCRRRLLVASWRHSCVESSEGEGSGRRVEVAGGAGVLMLAEVVMLGACRETRGLVSNAPACAATSCSDASERSKDKEERDGAVDVTCRKYQSHAILADAANCAQQKKIECVPAGPRTSFGTCRKPAVSLRRSEITPLTERARCRF